MAKSATRQVRSTLDGPGLRDTFAAGAAWLDSQVEAINALNVFPVPDGDTGTNMSLTMRSALEASSQATTGPGAFAEALARGALFGARGNSGVILSQVLRGFARGLGGKPAATGSDIAAALQEASASAYKAVPKPVEGTILTVAREVAEATRSRVGTGATPLEVLDLAATTARASVARTPLLLKVLRDNGVVDAGGQGLAVLLEGMARQLRGESAPPPAAPVERRPAAVAMAAVGDSHRQVYGFCTEFFIAGYPGETAQVRPRFEAMGDSVLVIGDNGLIKVHLHTLSPEPVLEFARSLGSVERVKIDNIDSQHAEFAAARAGATGIAAVVAGDGMAALFRSLGAGTIVPGGQTMNPSIQDLLQAVAGLPAGDVVLLPNNANVVLTAMQARDLAEDKRVHVIPTTDLPQGVAAMMAYNFEMDLATNLKAMEEARSSAKTAEVTRAVRRATLDGHSVARGDAIGLSGGVLVAAERDLPAVLERTLERLGVEDGAAVTLYHGAGVSAKEAEEASARLQRRFPEAEVQAFCGGQPHYHYLLSIE